MIRGIINAVIATAVFMIAVFLCGWAEQITENVIHELYKAKHAQIQKEASRD